MNQSCYTYEYVMSHIRMSRVTSSHVPYDWFMSRMNAPSSKSNESCHVWLSHVMYECNILQVEWVVSHMNESCHTWISHVSYAWVIIHVDESFHINRYCNATRAVDVICQWAMLHMNASCHMRMSHVSLQWGMSHINRRGAGSSGSRRTSKRTRFQ